jgi:hypothetical protein
MESQDGELVVNMVNWLRVLQMFLTSCSICSNSLLQVASPFLP